MFSQPVPLIRKLSEASYPYPSEYRQKEQELQPHGFLNENYHHRKQTEMITWVTALGNSMKLWAMPCRITQDGQGLGGEIWQNAVHWRREWQTTSVFLPREPHEQYIMWEVEGNFKRTVMQLLRNRQSFSRAPKKSKNNEWMQFVTSQEETFSSHCGGEK